MTIDTLEHLTVGSFLSTRHPCAIPKYQRGYAWVKKEVDDFCKDIDALLQGPGVAREHFFGSVVTSKIPAPQTQRGDYLEIIDGQQRLSTFFLTVSLLLRALEQIRQEADEAPDATTRDGAEAARVLWLNSFIEYEEIINNRIARCLRIKLSRIDAQFFEDLVHSRVNACPGPGQPSSHRRLFEARELIWKNLFQGFIDDGGSTPESKLNSVRTVKEAILSRCHLIHVRSDNRKDGYTLFKVLNDRGRDISDAEKLRASSLELLENYPVQQGYVENCWDSILQKKPETISAFLKAYFASKLGERPGRDLFRIYMEEFLDFENPAEVGDQQALQIRQVVDDIRTELDVYVLLAAGQWPFGNPGLGRWYQERVDRLINTLRHTLSLPLLLSAARVLPEERFAEMVVFIERLCFRHIVVEGAHAGALGESYNTAARRLREQGLAFDCEACYGELLALSTLTEAEFRPKLIEALAYKENNTARRRSILYLLTLAEDFFDWYNRGGNGVPSPNAANVIVDFDNLQVEHIYPQNPLPANVDTTMERLKHNLGNLTFFTPTDNRGARNDDFATKKALFQASGVKLNQALGRLTEPWDEFSFNERQRDLLNRACTIFLF